MSERSTLLDRLTIAQHKEEQILILGQSIDTPDKLDALARAALEYPVHFDALTLKLQSFHGLKGPAVRWERSVRKRMKEIEAQRDRVNSAYTPAEALRQLLARVDPDSALESPPGYTVRASSGVAQGDAQVCAHPLVILAEYRDIETREVSVEIAWLDVGGWERATVPRSSITDARKIGALADLGLDVSSENCGPVVAYLRAFGVHNRAALSRARVSTRCGWVGGSFLRGRHCHASPDGSPVVLDVDGGLAQIADAIGAVGDPDVWRAMVRDDVAHRPLVLLAIYASLAAPLLRLIGTPGFTVDWSGPSGRGKSTALDMACSVWANPEMYRRSWETSSAVAPQEIAAWLHNLPMCMDETNMLAASGRTDVLTQMLFLIPNGQERMRGQKSGGVRTFRTWHTVMLTTGEQRITSYAEGNVGPKRRAICISGTPMGSVSKSNADTAAEISATSRAHYGHCGAFFIDTLCGTPREKLKARAGALAASYRERGVGSTDRSLAPAVAAIELASELVRGWLPVEEGERLAAVECAWLAAVAGGEGSDEPRQAFDDLMAWVGANWARFLGTGPGREPSQGYVGRVVLDGQGDWTEIAMVPAELLALLRGWGRKPVYVVEEWARRGVLARSSDGRTKIKRAMKGAKVRLYVIQRDAETVREWLG